jgi:hypothetical protein
VSLDQVRAIADAVLYEGYLLYPYRASSAKNQSRWQFGVLGPPGAPFAEPPSMAMQCLLHGNNPTVRVHVRFLQLQTRTVEQRSPDGSYHPVPALPVGGQALISWDEAVEHEITLPPTRLPRTVDETISVFGGEDMELVEGESFGRVLRQRWPLSARIHLTAAQDGEYWRLSVGVENTAAGPPPDKDTAMRTSFIGAHLLLEAGDGEFVSLLEPPPEAADAAGRCHQDRCWPVLAGEAGSSDVVLGAPIILYDHPQIAEQSHGDLFDATEIDEILTLRVMTMTDEEKAEARATDPRAKAIIDRCDNLSPAELQQLHGVLRDPFFDDFSNDFFNGGADPETDAVLINGVRVSKGSIVRVHPSRRADAQDLFFAGQLARVTAVMSDVDGATHVALVLVDDPAADLHDWYGRYFYFAPDQLEPIRQEETAP